MAQPQASFYFNVQSREQALCQLVGKALKQRLAIGIAADSEATAARLDRLLWEVPATGFLPHCHPRDAVAAETPVWLDHRLDTLAGRAVLFNWTGQVVPAALGAGRVIEIVARDDEAGRQAARQRVAQYKDAGYAVDFTDMAQPRQS